MKNVYRAKNSAKIFILIFLSLSLMFSIGVWRGLPSGTNTWVELLFGILLVCVGSVMTAQIFTASVVVSDDSIRSGSVFRWQTLQWNQVQFRHEYEEFQQGADGGINVSYLELIPRNDLPVLRISKDEFDFDQAFWERVLRIRDIDGL